MAETALAPEDVALPHEDLSEEHDFLDTSEGYEASDEQEDDSRSKGKGEESLGTKSRVVRLIQMLPPEIREAYAFQCHVQHL